MANNRRRRWLLFLKFVASFHFGLSYDDFECSQFCMGKMSLSVVGGSMSHVFIIITIFSN